MDSTAFNGNFTVFLKIFMPANTEKSQYFETMYQFLTLRKMISVLTTFQSKGLILLDRAELAPRQRL